MGRVDGEADARDTPIGLPSAGALDLAGLDLGAEALDELLRVDLAVWKNEALLSRSFLDGLGAGLAPALERQQENLELRLARAGG